MRYDLGIMDMYPIESGGTNIENDPMFKVTFVSDVDGVKLEDAVYRAFRFHPLFETQVRFADGAYYLETNNRPVRLKKATDRDRPLTFGDTTNGFPWQMCYSGRDLTFEWCHGVTDGRGAFEFLKTVLSIYCGMRFPVVPRKIMLGPGLEPFVDHSEKGKDFDVQPKGFPVRALPIYKRGYKTDCHVLEARTEDVLKLAKECGSSPSAVLTVLLSQAIRKHLPENLSNKNVACNVVMDLRRPLHYETMHNCDEYKRLTYQDRHESMEFSEVAKEYKGILDHAREKENVVRMVTERITSFQIMHALVPTSGLRHAAMYVIGKVLKDTDCNCVLTYLGKTDFPEEVRNQVEDFQFRVWHDFGECILAAVDFEGSFRINLCENYIEKGIVEDFIKLCGERGIPMRQTEALEFEQGRFVEEGKTYGKKQNYGKEEERAPREMPVPVPDALGSPVSYS